MRRLVPLVVLLLAVPAWGADPAALIAAATGSSSFEVRELDLPAGLPEQWTVAVPHEGRLDVLELSRRSLRADDFRLRVWAGGVTTAIDPPPPATYQGRVAGRPGDVAGGALTPRGLRLTVSASGGGSWEIRPLADFDPEAPRSLHVIVASPGMPEGRACGVDGETAAAEPGAPAAKSLARRPIGRIDEPGDPAPESLAWCGPGWLKLTEIAFDVDQVYYRDLGSDVAAVTANVEAHLAAVDAFYRRDALITYVMTDLVVRTTDFYLPAPTTGSLLDLFRTEWTANQASVRRDVAHLMTGQPAPGLAGLAYVGVICNLGAGYGWSVDSSGVVGHELGHNWNAGHCHDVAPCNNMCGACLSIGPRTKEIIEAYRDSRACLDTTGPAASPLPPYAHPDAAPISRAEAVDRVPVFLDVLANDHDANCDDLRIASFDPVSRLGGSVALDAGGGPGGRDRLAYEAPCEPFAGLDELAYVVDDGAGGSAAATVSLDMADSPRSWSWPLDDGAGTTATEPLNDHHGAVEGGATWTTGHAGGALSLDGVDDRVVVPALGLGDVPLTITAWIRRRGNAPPFSGLVFCRGGSTVAGLHVGNSNELRYTWSDDPATWGSDSGLVLPDGAWTFVALVVEPARATLFMDDGSGPASWTNAIAHRRQAFDDSVLLGQDPAGGARFFPGDLDDVRITERALSAAEIAAVRDGVSATGGPRPADGAIVSDPDGVLSWHDAGGAGEFDVVFGRSLEAVAAATPGAPEHRGRVTGTSFDPPGLFLEGASYAWRVDAIVGGVPVPGPAWMFTHRGRPPRLLGYWRLDEGAGTAAADASGEGRDGTLVNGTTWAGGVHSGALSFDGVDDLVRAPALSRDLGELTITAWIRTRGMPAPWAGLVFCRGGSTTSGLGFRDGSELGYHWDGGAWGWSSGLFVPPDEWALVALAVSPAQATLSLFSGGTWQSATNVAGHAAEAFDDVLTLGRDPWGAARSFGGEMDDVRIFDRALGAAELESLRLSAPRAMQPDPPDGVLLASPPARLGWVPGADVTSCDVYLGPDLAALRAATPASSEFAGNVAGTSVAIPPPATGTWYWRVDARSGALVTPGEAWRFRVYEGVGATLRVRKSAAAEPLLSWSTEDAAGAFEIRRCAATPDPCVPATFTTLDAGARSLADAAALEQVIWFAVQAQPCP